MPERGGAVLLVDDTPTNLEVLVDYLTEQGVDVFVATSGEEALERARLTRPDVVLLDVMMPGLDGFETCERLKAEPDTRDVPVIFMTALSGTADKLRAFEVGAVDYVTKPIQQDEVLARVRAQLTIRRLQDDLESANRGLEARVAERTADLAEANQRLEQALAEVRALRDRLQAENDYLREEARRETTPILGDSEALRGVLDRIEAVAGTDATVLLTGESGVGKELLARRVHERSPRVDKPLVRVNCASVPRELFESEFFGHVKGSFTGAVRDREGRFALAEGGTLFLDEVGEIPLELQAKLLRVLQEREYERVGDPNPQRADVRIVAATNRDLEAEVEAGRFRADLYYRLSVFPIEVPPLRERPDDVVPLARALLERAARAFGRGPLGLSGEDEARLTAYGWPGNVRELSNVVERAVILSTDGRLRLDLALEGGPRRRVTTATQPSTPAPAADPGYVTLDEWRRLERENVTRALEAAGWRVAGKDGAAERLGVPPSTLQSQLKTLGIRRPG